jgi:hypothetical protein
VKRSEQQRQKTPVTARTLVFRNYGDTYVLERVWNANEENGFKLQPSKATGEPARA